MIYSVKTTNVVTGRVSTYLVYVINNKDNSITVTVTDDAENSIRYAPTQNGVIEYDGVTGEYREMFTKINNGSLVLSNENATGDTLDVSTVYQK